MPNPHTFTGDPKIAYEQKGHIEFKLYLYGIEMIMADQRTSVVTVLIVPLWN